MLGPTLKVQAPASQKHKIKIHQHFAKLLYFGYIVNKLAVRLNVPVYRSRQAVECFRYLVLV